jgi:L-cysteine desulfidase
MGDLDDVLDAWAAVAAAARAEGEAVRAMRDATAGSPGLMADLPGVVWPGEEAPGDAPPGEPG